MRCKNIRRLQVAPSAEVTGAKNAETKPRSNLVRGKATIRCLPSPPTARVLTHLIELHKGWIVMCQHSLDLLIGVQKSVVAETHQTLRGRLTLVHVPSCALCSSTTIRPPRSSPNSDQFGRQRCLSRGRYTAESRPI